MFQIRKILVALDFEGSTSVVEQTAYDLARMSNAELLLVNVLNDVPIMLAESPGYSPAEFFTDYERRVDGLLATTAERARAAGIQARCLLLRGFPDQRIVDAAKKEGADMILMGTHGRRGFKHFMLGSVAERVVRSSTVPVLTVRNAPSEVADAASPARE